MTDQDILKEARVRYAAGVDADGDNRQRQEEDMLFIKGGIHQWDSAILQARQGRPTVTINRLPQFIKQVTGEMRQNKPAIRILPVDDQTDPKLAEVYTAIIRHIENLSDAHRVYSRAGEQSVMAGIGWWRILTDYLSDTSFDQEIKVKSVKNPLSVVYDPASVELTRSDMNWAFVTEMMPEEDFKAAYPDAGLTGFTSDSEYGHWKKGEFIRVAEYWVREDHARELLLLSDGSTRFVDEVDMDEAATIDGLGLQIVDKRKVTTKKVRWYKMTGVEILAQGEWAGKYIPLVPVIGEEIEVGDETFRHGLVYHTKDSQRSYNFARSAMLEHVASQPKAPYLATSKMIGAHKEQWESLNTANPPVLLYESDPSVPGSRPVRESPPTFAAAWYQEAQTADSDMKATTGIYDASLGKAGNETSGRAIMARDQQGETATFIYVDNLSAAIRHTGAILLDLIPQIYTGERVIRILGEDMTVEGYERVNTMLPDGTVFNDISVGQFDLEVTTGPAFATKRMEAADKLMQLVQSVPQIGQIGADMIIQSLDIPHGDKLADRLAFMLLPPGVDEDVDRKREEAKAKSAPQGPDPMQQLAMAGEQAKVEKTQSETARNIADAELKKVQVEESAMNMEAMIRNAVLAEVHRLGLAIGAGDGL